MKLHFSCAFQFNLENGDLLEEWPHGYALENVTTYRGCDSQPNALRQMWDGVVAVLDTNGRSFYVPSMYVAQDTTVEMTHFQNREGMQGFNFHRKPVGATPGLSAMLRVKNEQSTIRSCLVASYELFDEIIVVDNDSTDNTVTVVKKFMAAKDPAGKVKLFRYPFPVARCGPEHERTAEDSVHSSVYYYNWCLARCTRTLVCKWDADMMLLEESRQALRAFVEGHQWSCPVALELPVQTVYVGTDGSCWLAKSEVNQEIRIFPNRSSLRFVKGKVSQTLGSERLLPVACCEHVCAYEIKDVSKDEFSHWTSAQFSTSRKKREWANYNKVATGNMDPDQFVPIERCW